MRPDQRHRTGYGAPLYGFAGNDGNDGNGGLENCHASICTFGKPLSKCSCRSSPRTFSEIFVRHLEPRKDCPKGPGDACRHTSTTELCQDCDYYVSRQQDSHASV